MVAAALAAASSAHVGSAEAAPRKGARLAWVRGIDADKCVGRIGLEEDVKGRLGYDPFALPSDLGIEGTIVRATPSGYRAEIIVRDAQGKLLGSRQLASKEPDCKSLGEAVAVAITVAIDPDSPAERAAAVEEIPPESIAPAPTPPSPLPPPAPPREDIARGAVVGGASAGLVPDVSPSLSFRVRAILGPRFELGLGATFWPESQTSNGIGFALVSSSVDACVVPFLSARVLRWCGAFHAGAFDVFVHAPELAPVEVGMFSWFAASTGPALLIPITGPVSIEASVSAVVPITRRQAFVRGTPEPVFEQSPVAGHADVGLGVTFR